MNEEFITDYDDTQEGADLEAISNRMELENTLNLANNIWGYSSTGIEAKRAAMSMLSTKTGMYARIPILCKADGCPYSSSCLLLQHNLAPQGEACPIETSQIELRLAGYEKDFDIEGASFTDKILITDLINHDIMLERCKSLITTEGTLIQDVVAGINERGEEFTRPEILKEYEAYDRILKKRNEIYDLMLATRKSKKGTDKEGSGDEWSKTVADVMEGNYEFVEDQKPDNID